MKKVLSILITLLALSTTVFAGDVPEALLYEDGAKVFIGTVENHTTKNIPSSPYTIIDTIEVIPTEKIKGDVKIGKKASVKNAIIMQGSVIGEGCDIEYAIIDKDVKITDGTVLKGSKNAPIIVEKGETV